MSSPSNQNWEIKSTSPSPKKKTSHVSALAITLIISVFIIALLASYFLIKTFFLSDQTNVLNLFKQGDFRSAKKITSKKIASHKGGSNTYLTRAKARIYHIRQYGNKTNWKNHLTSTTWDEKNTRPKNFYFSREGDSALTDLKKAISLNPKNAEAYQWLGILYQERRQFSRSKKYFSRAIRINPQNFETLNFMGALYVDLAEYPKAIKLFLSALRRAPRNPATLKNIGATYLYHIQDSKKALRFYLRYLSLNTKGDFDRPLIRKEVTKILWNKSFPFNTSPPLSFSPFESERKRLNKNLSRKKTYGTLAQLGSLFSKRKKYSEARLYWEQSLALNPNQTEVYQSLYQLQAHLELFSAASGTLKRASRHQSTTAEMSFALGLLTRYFEENKDLAVQNFKHYLNTKHHRYRRQAKLELDELLGK